MAWWWDEAARLSNEIRYDESDNLCIYDNDTVNQATVHMRQDTVMVASLLNSLNGQVRTI